MTVATFIAKNALRNKRRAALTILSVAVSCAAAGDAPDTSARVDHTA